MIEYVTKDLIADNLLFVDPVGQGELTLRVMAQERRFERRFLSQAMIEVLLQERSVVA